MIKLELIKSEATIFSNSVIIIFAKTGPNKNPMEIPSICLYNLLLQKIVYYYFIGDEVVANCNQDSKDADN